MPEETDVLEQCIDELKRHSPTALQAFMSAAPLMRQRLSHEYFQRWIVSGLEIARGPFRSWEAAVEYFRASPDVLHLLKFPQLIQWGARGKDISNTSSELAVAYFKASPNVLPLLSSYQVVLWAGLGESLYRGEWQSGALAVYFFESSQRLLLTTSFSETETVVNIMNNLIDEGAYESARRCLDSSLESIPKLDKAIRKHVLELISVLVLRTKKVPVGLLEAASISLSMVAREEQIKFVSLGTKIAWLSPEDAITYFLEGSQSLNKINHSVHARILYLTEELLQYSPQLTTAFIKNCQSLLTKLRPLDLDAWVAKGIQVLKERPDAGLSFFRVQSAQAEEFLTELSRGVELQQIAELMQLYVKALTGVNIQVLPLENLTKKGIGWTSESAPTTEGTNIFLPSYVQTYQEKNENFNCYKVYATHQSAHLEFGSFLFQFEREGPAFSILRVELAKHLTPDGSSLVEMERFLDLFPIRALVSDLFAVAEDARVDAITKSEYPGIRRWIKKIQKDEVDKRSDLSAMPIREAFVDALLRWSMDESMTVLMPEEYHLAFQVAATVLKQVFKNGTLVEDSAEAALRLYLVVSRLPGRQQPYAQEDQWTPVDLTAMQNMTADEGMEKLLGESVGSSSSLAALISASKDSSEETTYHRISDVESRGEFKPELVQTLMRLKEDAKDPKNAMVSPLSQEELEALLNKIGETEISSLGEGEVTTSSGLFVTNLIREAGIPASAMAPGSSIAAPKSKDEPNDEALKASEPGWYLYDEWDFRANDYRPDWCLIKEKPLEDGSTEFYDDTLKKHSKLAAEIRKQFELLRPEVFKKIKKLTDGEEFELDDVVEAAIEKRAGVTPSDKLYWRRNKEERSVAMAFLLDMSASTDEDIVKDREQSVEIDWDDPRAYMIYLNERARIGKKTRRRIIDVEKESTVLLVHALETVGDTYGVYGFSGYGRDDVEFFIIKDMKEKLSNAVKARIDRIHPVRGTRMGPAIRHTIAKLNSTDARIKVLILVSDGRPQDHNYGRDRTEKDYAIRDTHMALTEARRRRIVPFCLTVDQEGHDYLASMCDDMGYEVVHQIESLPSRLPTLYRMLTS
ncbi:MAG: hypothetical protein EXR50_03095 [Dehalococcoidia bacterium]|nr:hypothetical protein [Dehalococcoidia bacterium]